jgi:phage shock protein C
MQHVENQGLYRSNNRILGGVCAGLAEGFHIDPLWVRIAFVVLLFLQGVGLFLYVVLWLVMPERLEGGGHRTGFDAMSADLRRVWAEFQHQVGGAPVPSSTAPPSTSTPTATASPDPQAPAPAPTGPRPQSVWQNQPVVFGVILVVIGLTLLASNMGIINWSVVWPAALITVGIVILVRNLERRP